jgi:ABC-type multidrug transport system fused ATPase/permease subunit
MKWWRSQIGLVQQEPFLFNETIFKNISHGLIGTEWEEADEEKKRELVKQACTEAFADEFISRLPEVSVGPRTWCNCILIIDHRAMTHQLERLVAS